MESGIKIHFTLGEINNFANVGEMANNIIKTFGINYESTSHWLFSKKYRKCC